MAQTTQISVLGNENRIPTQSVDIDLAYEVTDEITGLAHYAPDFRSDSLFPEVMRHMQNGNWELAVRSLRAMQAKYPNVPELNLIMNDALLKTQLDSAWGNKVKGRALSISPGKLAMRIASVVLVLLLAFGALSGYRYYQDFQASNALLREKQALLDSAQLALDEARFDEAIALFTQVLEQYPEDSTAEKGIADAQWQKELLAEYNSGINAMDTQEYVLAMDIFTAINAKAPGYRDVASLIEQLRGSAQVSALFLAAEEAYEQEEWATAIERYEELRAIDGAYKEEIVSEHLFDSYMRGGQTIVQGNPAEEELDLITAQDYFQNSLKIKFGEETAKEESTLLDSYLLGETAFQSSNYVQAIAAMRPVYDARPDYLQGYVADQLYDTYLTTADEAVEDGQVDYALTQLGRAAALQVDDRSEALRELRELAISLTPTPTPIPTATPVPPPAPPTPKPPLGLNQLVGRILFTSNRDGGQGLYAMLPDGSDVRKAPREASQYYNAFIEQEMWSPDGTAKLFVATRKDYKDSAANIYKLRNDLPDNWKREFILTELTGLEYEPVWSPDNQWIAFVATNSGNDEIWIMDTEGENKKQLTKNGWEWDKKPTWSPDSQTIVFWSNRSGLRQLWTMNPDGSNQQPLTDEYENWDPIWIKSIPELPEEEQR